MYKGWEQGQLISRVSIYLDNNPDFGAFSVPYIAKRLRVKTDTMWSALNVMRCRGMLETKPDPRPNVRIATPLILRASPQNVEYAASYRRSAINSRMSDMSERLLREEILRRKESWDHQKIDGIER